MAETETTTTEAEYKATRLWNEIKYSANKLLNKYNMSYPQGNGIVLFITVQLPGNMYDTLAVPGFIEKIGKESGFCIEQNMLLHDNEIRVHISHYETIDVGGDKG